MQAYNLNIYPTNEYLINFFENLINDGANELNNQELFVENN